MRFSCFNFGDNDKSRGNCSSTIQFNSANVVKFGRIIKGDCLIKGGPILIVFRYAAMINILIFCK
jgi:hypothetical protein